MRDVIVVLGETASGKSTFTKYVHHHYGYDVYEVGDYVRAEYKNGRQMNHYELHPIC